jgi:hypothetical protein
MIDEQYIEHEIKIRVLKEMADERINTSDKRFINIDARFDKLEAKIDSNFNNLLIMFIASVLMPVALHAMKLI